MKKRNCVAWLTLLVLASKGTAEELDYYKYLRYQTGLQPGIGRNKVAQEGGPDAVGYERRTVQWWPRKGQDIVDIPKGAPLRTWTRNKGKEDKEALAGLCRNWTTSDPETFKAHLIAFRAFGTSTPRKGGPAHIPTAVLRMEDGSARAVTNYGAITQMISKEDHDFIQKTWEKAYPKLYATISPDPRISRKGGPRDKLKEGWKLYEAAPAKFNGMPWLKQDAKYPVRGETERQMVFETQHFRIASDKTARGSGGWIRPDDIKYQTLNHKNTFEHIENLWAYVQASGASMPYWRFEGENYKYVITATPGGAGGGHGGCGIGGASLNALGHEFYHGQSMGGWDLNVFAETTCNAGQHAMIPGEMQMFSGNFRHPWLNVNTTRYQSSLWCFALGDNPNWGYGIPIVMGCLAGGGEPTAYHTIARLGQKKGLWKNGIKGFGDFFGEYAARMVTIDLVEQPMLRCKYGMPARSYVYPAYGRENTWRIPNAEAPRIYGYNIIRLTPAEGAKEITVDFRGLHDPRFHSDWRACIVAMDGNGKARYSPLWNKGKMSFALKPSDKRTWLTVAATPSALFSPGGTTNYLFGFHAPRYPWEITLTGAAPDTPHRMQGDVVNYDELYTINNGNKFVDLGVKHEVPIPLVSPGGKLAQEKLADMLSRIEASTGAVKEKIKSGRYNEKGWWEMRKTEILDDLSSRVKFLQRNAKGKRHPNGTGFVSDSAKVAATAYVGPNAMVLDGAQVKDNACIKEFAVVLGPKTVISGNAKIGGKAWVCGDLKIGENARILQGTTVITLYRRRTRRSEGAAEIKGSVVIKGVGYLNLCNARDQVLTGGIVSDYGGGMRNKKPGVFSAGRFCLGAQLSQGADNGALYANWEFDQPKAFELEDSYVDNDGILYGSPTFATHDEHKCVVFNGTDQYAEAPPSVADFGELTIDMSINRSGGKGGRLFDFGTGADECFHLAIGAQDDKPSLTAKHKGKSYSLTAQQGVPAGKWARVRVEMDGKTASIYIDGTQVAKGKFEFRPRDVFIGDRPEGNFIACGRDKKDFFSGRMDHFRIYRKVHKDFSALGEAPFPLTQTITPESIAKAKKLSDDWEKFKKVRWAELNKTSGYDAMTEKIKALDELKKKTKSKDEIARIEAKKKQLAKDRHAIWWQNLRAIGGNPYSSLTGGAGIMRFQQNVKHHTTIDWDTRVPEEASGKAPPKMKKWLKMVRGY